METTIQEWNKVYTPLRNLVIPVLFTLGVIYIVLCLINIFFLYWFMVFYLLVASVSREIFFTSDLFTSWVVGYHNMQSYLWSFVVKPPKRVTWVKMYVFWIMLFKPAWECRIRRLSREKKKYKIAEKKGGEGIHASCTRLP